MTFRELMAENGYELQTTFWNDFRSLIALESKLSTIHTNVHSVNGKITINTSLNSF